MNSSQPYLESSAVKAKKEPFMGSLGRRTSVVGLLCYSVFAPHSVAGAEVAVAIASTGWLISILANGRSGLRHTEFDVPIFLFLVWTLLSSALSQEPDISLAKLQSSWIPLVFYLTQAVITRRNAIILVSVLVLSGCAGALYSFYDLARGRGVVIESVSSSSPFQAIAIRPGDTIWRLDDRRVYSTTDIDEILRATPASKRITVSVISEGEHVERTGLRISNQSLSLSSPSGLTGNSPSHRFRASGWTRHYETFSELLQIIAQLSLGLALANLRNHGTNVRFKLAIAACFLLSLGIAFTAMRTVLVAFALGAIVLVWRSIQGRQRLFLLGALVVILIVGGFFVWTTRAQRALELGDDSSSLRSQVARVGLSRVMLHPVFGHGMDAVHRHWNEWGFPGSDMIHLHSTPLQIAFDRGLPALLFWLWIVIAFWLAAARAEKAARDLSDTNRYGVLLGTVGAVTGFFASSLVNYNFGDAEVALMFWWLLGVMVSLRASPSDTTT